jgi:hypothetical protein
MSTVCLSQICQVIKGYRRNTNKKPGNPNKNPGNPNNKY